MRGCSCGGGGGGCGSCGGSTCGTSGNGSSGSPAATGGNPAGTGGSGNTNSTLGSKNSLSPFFPFPAEKRLQSWGVQSASSRDSLVAVATCHHEGSAASGCSARSWGLAGRRARTAVSSSFAVVGEEGRSAVAWSPAVRYGLVHGMVPRSVRERRTTIVMGVLMRVRARSIVGWVLGVEGEEIYVCMCMSAEGRIVAEVCVGQKGRWEGKVEGWERGLRGW